MDKDKNGWEQWSKHVLKELETLNDGIGVLEKDIVQMKIDIALLKYKSGLWGALAGIVSAGGLLIWEAVKGKL